MKESAAKAGLVNCRLTIVAAMRNAGLCRIAAEIPGLARIQGSCSLAAIRHNRRGYRFFKKLSSSSSGRNRSSLASMGAAFLRACSLRARSASR